MKCPQLVKMDMAFVQNLFDSVSTVCAFCTAQIIGRKVHPNYVKKKVTGQFSHDSYNKKIDITMGLSDLYLPPPHAHATNAGGGDLYLPPRYKCGGGSDF